MLVFWYLSFVALDLYRAAQLPPPAYMQSPAKARPTCRGSGCRVCCRLWRAAQLLPPACMQSPAEAHFVAIRGVSVTLYLRSASQLRCLLFNVVVCYVSVEDQTS